MASAHALGFFRVISHEPVGHVQVVNMLFDDVITADPVEVVPILHLVLEFCLARLAWVRPNAATVPIDARVNQVADDSILQLCDGFHVGSFMTAL